MAYDKYEYYQELKDNLEQAGCTVEDYKEINYGLQFEVSFKGKKSLIRVYEGKKGLRVDLSQVKDEGMLEFLSNYFNEGTDKRAALNQGSGSSSEDPEELIGTDESGKGDYFGPLVIGAVYVNSSSAQELLRLGVDDSKKLTDKQIGKLAPQIKDLCPHSIVIIGNERYNELYESIKNLNKMLAWGHARAIENILEKVDCSFALSDQFGNPSLIENALMDRGKRITLYQRPRAEENAAVAAASILARNAFVEKVASLEETYGMSFPKGASSAVFTAARNFVEKYGMYELSKVAKLHFKTTDKL